MGTSFLNVFENSNLYQELHFIYDSRLFWAASTGGSRNSRETLAQLAATISTGICCLPLLLCTHCGPGVILQRVLHVLQTWNSLAPVVLPPTLLWVPQISETKTDFCK